MKEINFTYRDTFNVSIKRKRKHYNKRNRYSKWTDRGKGEEKKEREQYARNNGTREKKKRKHVKKKE